jgi:uncharacterized protein YdhG (YjbR/CyaY superfamily)
MATKHPATVDEYLAAVPTEEARSSLSRLREIIREEAPEAEEVIKYGIPTYKSNGYVVSFAAFKNHCSLFPGHTVADFSEELHGFKTEKGTVQFSPDKPIPEALVRSMIRARLADNRGQVS